MIESFLNIFLEDHPMRFQLEPCCIHGSKLFIHSTHCIQQVYGTHWDLSTTIKQDGTSWTLKLEHPSNKYLFCFKSRPDLKVSYTKKFSSLSFDTNFVTNCRLRIPNKSHQKSLSVLLNVLQMDGGSIYFLTLFIV